MHTFPAARDAEAGPSHGCRTTVLRRRASRRWHLPHETEHPMSTAVATRVRAGAWSVDRAHSKVAFAVKHMGIANVRGQFEEFEGTLEIGNDLSSAKVYGKVNAQSGDTNEPRRDEHLRSPDFLDAARFPEIAFESSRIEALDGDRFRITGRLTIHGVTNELVLHAGVHGTHTDRYGNERIGLEVTGTLSRGDYGMRFNMGLGSGNSSWATRSTWRWTSPPSSTAEHLSAGRRRAPASCATRRDRQRTSLPVRSPPDGASWPRPPVVRCPPSASPGSERARRRWRRG